MQTMTLIGPSHWASYLINGDVTGLEPEDVAKCDAWLMREGVGACLTCDDAGFCWHHDADRELPLGTDCQTYTFAMDDGEPDIEPLLAWLDDQDDAAAVLRDLGRA